MHTSVIQLPGVGRKRGRYSDEFKRQVMATCKQPGVSTAAVALANGLNANLLRRWISDSGLANKPRAARQASTAVGRSGQTQFIPLQLQANGAAQTNIQIELQRGATLVRLQWPAACATECATWMREVLK
jgi:transposase-like protein